jgi:hypothetical protein
MSTSFDEFRSRKIKVFKNGDTWTAGKKMIVSNRACRNYEQVLFIGLIKVSLSNS